MISIASLAVMAQLVIIPADVQYSLDKAIATDDEFIIAAVISKAKQENPNYALDIDQYVYEKTITPAPEVEVLDPASGEEEQLFFGLTGSVEGGILVQTGNSDTENLNGVLKLTKEHDDWEHVFEASAINNSSDDVRSAEEYRANIQSRSNISSTDYIFGELDWVKDRYSGFEYRLSELVGYGHKYYDTDELKLSAEGAIGMQQSQEEGKSSENNFIQKVAGDLEWAINENLDFTQHLSTEHANGIFFSLSKSALKSKITDSLAFKFGVDLEHISEVPQGTEKLDTQTKANVVYDF